MAGVEADVENYVPGGLSEKVIFLEIWGDLDV